MICFLGVERLMTTETWKAEKEGFVIANGARAKELQGFWQWRGIKFRPGSAGPPKPYQGFQGSDGLGFVDLLVEFSR